MSRGRTIRAVAVALAAAAVAAGCGGGGDGDAPDAAAVEAVVRAIEPSIVTVEVEQDGRPWKGGTGVVWSSDGLVVTANHVVEDGDRVLVRDVRGRESAAEVVGTDEGLDLALLRVRHRDLVPARFASGLPELGALAVTVGRPPPSDELRFEAGRIVELHAAAFRLRGWDDLIESDANVRHGDSGGALAGAGAVVYGILLASDVEGGLREEGPADRAYAVHTPRVRAFVRRALEGGAAEPGFLGVDAADVTDELRDRLELDLDDGVVILGVEPGTPADRAGLRFRDAILAIDGAPVERLADLDDALREHGPGSHVAMQVLREGEERTVEVVLGRRPSD